MVKLFFKLEMAIELEVEAQDQVQDYLTDIDLPTYVPDSLKITPCEPEKFYALPVKFKDTETYKEILLKELEFIENRIKYLQMEQQRRIAEQKIEGEKAK